MDKPKPRTLSYYEWTEFQAYIRSERPSARWILHKDWHWEGDEFVKDLEDWQQDADAFPDAYASGAAIDLAWLREQFGNVITVRR